MSHDDIDDPDRSFDDASGGAPKRPADKRLDPLAAARAAGLRPGVTTPVIDTRRYQRRIAYIGFGIVVTISIILFVTNGVNTAGIPVGQTLHKFVAPLDNSGINLPANADPHCDPSKPNLKALNVCNRQPIVLAFFVTGDGDCVKQVDALNKIAHRFPNITFAALSVEGNLSDTLKLANQHHWTIPIGVDSDGRVGAVYGVQVCPMLQMAKPGGKVTARLIGNAWSSPRALAREVREHLAQYA